MKLVLIRHGESEWNKANLFTGWTDVRLSEKGIEEAKEAGQILKKKGFQFDIAYTSYLTRAIHTLNYVLDEMDLNWIPVQKSWRLNERHYGALQGLNKKETAEKYGDEQVLMWRRSFDVMPPALDPEDERSAAQDPRYADLDPKAIPMHESLETTIERVIPYFEKEIRPKVLEGEDVLIVAHGNSLRALVKYLEKMSDDEILKVNIPTGNPLIFEFDQDFNVLNKYYLKSEN